MVKKILSFVGIIALAGLVGWGFVFFKGVRDKNMQTSVSVEEFAEAAQRLGFYIEIIEEDPAERGISRQCIAWKKIDDKELLVEFYQLTSPENAKDMFGYFYRQFKKEIPYYIDYGFLNESNLFGNAQDYLFLGTGKSGLIIRVRDTFALSVPATTGHRIEAEALFREIDYKFSLDR